LLPAEADCAVHDAVPTGEVLCVSQVMVV